MTHAIVSTPRKNVKKLAPARLYGEMMYAVSMWRREP